jgi:hypothetical protein
VAQLEYGIHQLRDVQAATVVVAEIHRPTAADLEYRAALALQDRDFQVVREYVSTMTAKTRTTAAAAAAQAVLD